MHFLTQASPAKTWGTGRGRNQVGFPQGYGYQTYPQTLGILLTVHPNLVFTFQNRWWILCTSNQHDFWAVANLRASTMIGYFRSFTMCPQPITHQFAELVPISIGWHPTKFLQTSAFHNMVVLPFLFPLITIHGYHLVKKFVNCATISWMVATNIEACYMHTCKSGLTKQWTPLWLVHAP